LVINIQSIHDALSEKHQAEHMLASQEKKICSMDLEFK